MPTSASSSLSAVAIRIPGLSSKIPSSLTTQLLREIGKKEGVLDIHALERMSLGQSFAQFDMSAITPTELGLVSKNLYALGLIDKTTANLMVVAGTSLDAMGNQTHPDQKMNSLDFFSARIHSLRTAGAGSNEYGFHVVPDYIKTVHVLQNLDDFAQAQRSQQGARSAISGQVNIVKNHAKGISVKV